MRRLAALPLALGLIACTALADEPPSASPAPAAVARPMKLEQVAWMAGTWRGVTDGVKQEELWMAPAGGLMLGLHRDVMPAGVSFEYLRLEQDREGVVYQASPGGAPPTPFRLVEASPTRAVFANPEHDFPKRIIYTLKGDELTARIEGDGPEGMQWTWKRSTGP
jgi:hypothetical protein